MFSSISNHNRLEVRGNENHICVYFSKLFRDVDKLDIFKLVLNDHYLPAEKRSAADSLCRRP